MQMTILLKFLIYYQVVWSTNYMYNCKDKMHISFLGNLGNTLIIVDSTSTHTNSYHLMANNWLTFQVT